MDAACQADLDVRPVTCDEPVDPAPGAPAEEAPEQGPRAFALADFYATPLAFNRRSGRMHLVVPEGLQTAADRPRAFCGWAFWKTPERAEPASRFPEDPEAICDKCFPRLKAFTAKRLYRAADHARALHEADARVG